MNLLGCSCLYIPCSWLQYKVTVIIGIVCERIDWMTRLQFPYGGQLRGNVTVTLSCLLMECFQHNSHEDAALYNRLYTNIFIVNFFVIVFENQWVDYTCSFRMVVTIGWFTHLVMSIDHKNNNYNWVTCLWVGITNKAAY